MNIAGIVAEYNPFHNGHLRQVQFLRRQGFDGVIAAMSGNFVQRAEPALTEKYLRAELAVICGVDLVLELPLPYAVASAENFARGGIGILHATGVVRTVCCGCESDEDDLRVQYQTLQQAEQSGQIAARMKTGEPYTAAGKKAVEALGGTWSNGANDLLYIAYRKALDRLGSPMDLITLKRDTDHRGTGSGSAIREKFLHGQNISDDVPLPCAETLRTAPIADFCRIERATAAFYRTAETSDLQKYYGFREGIENRIVRTSDAKNLTEWLDRVKTKRFPYSAVRRAVLCGFLGVTNPLPDLSYIRVLAFNDTGRKILRNMKQTACLPVLSSLTKEAAETPLGKQQLRGDELFQLTLPLPGARFRDRKETARYCPGTHDEF